MTARKINVQQYTIAVGGSAGQDGQDGQVAAKLVPYDVRQSAVNILLHPDRRMNGTAFLKAADLGRKILNEPGNEVLLNSEEFANLATAVEQFAGYSRQDEEFIRRILEAPVVELTAATTTPPAVATPA